MTLRSLLLAGLCATLLPSSALAISVSGVVTTTDGSSPAGVLIRVEQVGGELPIFSTTTAANGSWSVSDPLLFGNIRITASRAGYRLTPEEIVRFTDTNITDGHFIAAPLVPDLTVVNPGGNVLAAGATVTFAADFPGSVRTLTLTLRNDGIGAMHNLAAALSGPQAADFAIVAPPPATLAARASTSLTLTWTPAASGPRSAVLTISSDDPDEGTFPVNLSGEALSLDLLTVSNNSESGAGSLRAALAQAAAVSGPHRVRFDPALNGASIVIPNQYVINDPDGVTIDAGSLPDGLLIRGSNRARHFRILAGASLTLVNLRLTNGRANDSEDRGGSIRNEGTLVLRQCRLAGNLSNLIEAAGGAISNSGQMTLQECELTENLASYGGAIYNEGTASLTDCTLYSNGGFLSTVSGGAIISSGPLSLTRCQLTGNTVITSGGALFVTGPTTLTACTLSGNRCNAGGRGGAIMNTTGLLQLVHCTVTLNNVNGIQQDSASGSTHLRHCIVAGNGQFEDNLGGLGSFIFFDAPNLVRSPPPNVVGQAPLQADPLLSPLGTFGGKTLTHALLLGSPARNAAVGSTATSDQREFPIVGVPDLGAYETGTLAPNFFAYVWETLPATATAAERAPGFDFDGDGQSNQDEWLAQTDAASARSFFKAALGAAGTSLAIDFPSAAGRRYVLQASSSLSSDFFQPVSGQPVLQGNGTVLRFTVDPSGPRQFFRVQAMP